MGARCTDASNSSPLDSSALVLADAVMARRNKPQAELGPQGRMDPSSLPTLRSIGPTKLLETRTEQIMGRFFLHRKHTRETDVPCAAGGPKMKTVFFSFMPLP